MATCRLNTTPKQAQSTEAACLLQRSIAKPSVDAPEAELEVLLNGRPIGRIRGFEANAVRREARKDPQTRLESIRLRQRIALQAGENRMEASLRYQGARLMTQTARLAYTPPAPSVKRPSAQWWYFGVGVSSYQINTQNLDYAHRDADMKKPYSGVNLRDFHDYLSTRPLNQKVMLLDICHAGTIAPAGALAPKMPCARWAKVQVPWCLPPPAAGSTRWCRDRRT